jgi:hypothetical protein
MEDPDLDQWCELKEGGWLSAAAGLWEFV